MTAEELRKKYIDFFVERGHKQIPSASLIPENDPTALFISAGMHPLVPYLLGEPHPLGKRICSIQKCVRTVDIDSVGDTFHQTFFEMLGNWSLGDYWKEEMIPWSFEFLTKVLEIPLKRISVTCFAGDQDAPRDEQSANLWKKVGIPKERIYFLPKSDNWWGPAGKVGPCGPDTEMFFDTGKQKCGPNCRPGCPCGKYFEIWNDVFMEYNKTPEGKFEPLKQKNVDTGMGVERTIAVLNGFDDVYQTELFIPIIAKIEEISGRKYSEVKNKKPMRVIADHLRAATFIIADGVSPSNVEQGYVLRRLIRRAIRYGRALQLNEVFTPKVVEIVIEVMSDVYPELQSNKAVIFKLLSTEEEKFSRTLNKGLREFEKLLEEIGKERVLPGSKVFFLYETYGFPIELTEELAKEKGISIDKEAVQKAMASHQEKSREGAGKKFAGGLADHSEIVVKYHTATHLLHAALRKILGNQVRQVGSNLTAERLRFDFTYPQKMTEDQINQVENLVNEKISLGLPVKEEIMSLKEAQKKGALAFFGQKYGEMVKVYTIGDFSMEVCGGPHVKNTKEIGKIKIFKEESIGVGKRRIYARVVE